MILNGNQRGGAKDLALHLMKDENERVEVHQLRGFMSPDLMGALNEMYAISQGTRCKQFMYSLSLNPPKDGVVSIAGFESAVERAEKRLGLEGQPRAIVFHEKEGRRHCHVVWSRIDINTMTARRMSHDREKLTDLSREFFLEYGWKMPKGIEKRGERSPLNYTHAEYQQARRTGRNAGQIKADIQEAWNMSDNRASLEHALAEKGFYLARGDKRSFVVVHTYGEIYSLPKQLAKGINTKQVRERLGDPSELPSIEEILERIAKEKPQEITVSKEDVLKRITRFHSAFTVPMMKRTLKPVIKNELERKVAIDAVLQSGSLIKIGEQNGQAVYSTKAMMDLEKHMAENAHAMVCSKTHPSDDMAVKQAIFNLNNKLHKETNGKASLSREQKQAFRHMTSDKQLSLVVGVAGAGKTTIMEGAKEALEAQGYRVRGAAPSGIAASGLRDIGMKASTLHSLEARIRIANEMIDSNAGKALSPKQQAFIKSTILTNKDVLIVDEAGMVSAGQLANIIELTKQSGAKLVLVGDPAQLQSIEAGSAFRTLLERNESASLTEVRRQKTDWQREATIALSKGNVEKALKSYEKKGHVHFTKTRDEAKERLVGDVMHSYNQRPDKSRLVLAYTRKDVAELNTMIKAEMVAFGRVSTDNTEIQVTIKEDDIERQETQGFAVGDRILFRENDTNLGVMNGSFGTLKSIHMNRFCVTLDSGNEITFSPKEYSHFQLGYASTVHKSQGVTVDKTFVLASKHFDRHTSYVAMSRHKEDVKLYASKKEFKKRSLFYQSLGRQGEKISTLDFTDARIKQREHEKLPERKSFLKTIWNRVAGNKPKTEPDPNPKPEKQLSGEWIKTLSTEPKPEIKSPERTISHKELSAIRDEFLEKTQNQQHQNNRPYERDGLDFDR